MTRTKLGSASRFGPRYGSPLKQRIRDIEKVQKTAQICPQCGRRSLRRKGYSIWVCKKCKAKIAGGAYEPRTAAGRLVYRVVKKAEKYKKVIEELEEELLEEKGEHKETEEVEETKERDKKAKVEVEKEEKQEDEKKE